MRFRSYNGGLLCVWLRMIKKALGLMISACGRRYIEPSMPSISLTISATHAIPTLKRTT